MDWLNLLDVSFLGELLSDSGKASLAEKLMIIGVVWVVMGKKVGKHFVSLESGMRDGFAQLTASISEVKHALTEVEKNHAGRIENVANSVDRLSRRVDKLEYDSDSDSDSAR